MQDEHPSVHYPDPSVQLNSGETRVRGRAVQDPPLSAEWLAALAVFCGFACPVGPGMAGAGAVGVPVTSGKFGRILMTSGYGRA
jgi:hypothetical protein